MNPVMYMVETKVKVTSILPTLNFLSLFSHKVLSRQAY